MLGTCYKNNECYASSSFKMGTGRVFFSQRHHETWRDCFDGKTQVINFFMVLEKPFSFCLKQAER